MTAQDYSRPDGQPTRALLIEAGAFLAACPIPPETIDAQPAPRVGVPWETPFRRASQCQWKCAESHEVGMMGNYCQTHCVQRTAIPEHELAETIDAQRQRAQLAKDISKPHLPQHVIDQMKCAETCHSGCNFIDGCRKARELAEQRATVELAANITETGKQILHVMLATGSPGQQIAAIMYCLDTDSIAARNASKASKCACTPSWPFLPAPQCLIHS